MATAAAGRAGRDAPCAPAAPPPPRLPAAGRPLAAGGRRVPGAAGGKVTAERALPAGPDTAPRPRLSAPPAQPGSAAPPGRCRSLSRLLRGAAGGAGAESPPAGRAAGLGRDTALGAGLPLPAPARSHIPARRQQNVPLPPARGQRFPESCSEPRGGQGAGARDPAVHLRRLLPPLSLPAGAWRGRPGRAGGSGCAMRPRPGRCSRWGVGEHPVFPSVEPDFGPGAQGVPLPEFSGSAASRPATNVPANGQRGAAPPRRDPGAGDAGLQRDTPQRDTPQRDTPAPKSGVALAGDVTWRLGGAVAPATPPSLVGSCFPHTHSKDTLATKTGHVY